MVLFESGIAPLNASAADAALAAALQHKIDFKTKPLGALGRLEALALQLGCIVGSEQVQLTAPQMLVFAADHGITAEGVSAFPQAVTQQMVGNMLAGGAAVNVFARQHGFALTLVDAGVAAALPAHPQLQQRKIALGTQNACTGPAMTPAQAEAALRAGMDVVRGLPGNVLALGEMGIGNTSSAALIFALLAGLPVAQVAGRGTGLDDAQMQGKIAALEKAQALHAGAALAKGADGAPSGPAAALAVLGAVGGFEIAMMAGAMLRAAHGRRVVLVDGFIASAAALVACRIEPHAIERMVFCHVGAEHGHHALLAHLQAVPLLNLGLRLGEGSGALLAWPLVQSAALFLNEMASFESAGVSGKTAG